MQLLERFQQYAADFEKTYLDDDWSRLDQYFLEDATYDTVGVSAESGFGGLAEGRAAIYAKIRASLDRFDRRFDSRKLEITAPPEIGESSVTLHWVATYTLEGAPDLRLPGIETANYEGDLIRSLIDTYTSETADYLAGWMKEHGKNLPQETPSNS